MLMLNWLTSWVQKICFRKAIRALTPPSIPEELHQLERLLDRVSVPSEIEEIAIKLQVIERRPDAADHSDEIDKFRSDLLSEYKEIISDTSQYYIQFVLKHWGVSAGVVVLVLTIIGFVHSVFYFGSFDMSPGPYVETVQDVLLLSFAGGVAPIIFLLTIVSALAVVTVSTVKMITTGTPSTISTQHILRSVRLIDYKRVGYVAGISILVFSIFTLADITHFYARHPLVEIHTKSYNTVEGRLLGSTSKFLFVGSVCETQESLQAENCNRDVLTSQPAMAFSKSEVLCIGMACDKTISTPKLRENKFTPAESLAIGQTMYALGRSGAAGQEVSPQVFGRTFLGCEPTSTRVFVSFEDGKPTQEELDKEIVEGVLEPLDGETKSVKDIRKDIAAWLTNLPPGNVRLYSSGFASPTSSPTYNFDLSERRATWFNKILLTHEAPEGSRFSIAMPSGFGETVVLSQSESGVSIPSSRKYVAVAACKI